MSPGRCERTGESNAETDTRAGKNLDAHLTDQTTLHLGARRRRPIEPTELVRDDRAIQLLVRVERR